MKKFSTIQEALELDLINDTFKEEIEKLVRIVDPKEVKVSFINWEVDNTDFGQGLNISINMPEEPLDQCIDEIQQIQKIIQDNFKVKKSALRSHEYIRSGGGGGANYYVIYFLIDEKDLKNNNIFTSLVGINKYDL
jgi:hypothetical protein